MFTSGQLSTIFPRGVRLSSVRGCWLARILSGRPLLTHQTNLDKKLLEWRQSEWSEMIESYAEAIKGLCKKIGEIRRINLEAVWGVGLAAMQVHLLYTPHYLHPRPCHPLSQSWSPWSLVGYSATKAWCWIDPGSPREEYMMGLLCRLGKKIKDDKKLDRALDFAVFVLSVTAFCHISQSCCLLPASFLCFTTNISNHIVKCPQRIFESYNCLKSLDFPIRSGK